MLGAENDHWHVRIRTLQTTEKFGDPHFSPAPACNAGASSDGACYLNALLAPNTARASLHLIAHWITA